MESILFFHEITWHIIKHVLLTSTWMQPIRQLMRLKAIGTKTALKILRIIT